MLRLALIALLGLTLAPQALAAGEPKQVRPDRAAITALLDEFVPAVVAQKDLKRGWRLAGGFARTTPYGEWIKGNTSVQAYPAKGTHFPGWTVNYSYPGDVGFDILLRPTRRSLGARSFRAEAQRIRGRWRITTWYPVAMFAPTGRTQTVLGPNDFGPAGGPASAGSPKARLGSWVLLVPAAALAALAAGGIGFAAARSARERSRARALARSLAR